VGGEVIKEGTLKLEEVQKIRLVRMTLPTPGKVNLLTGQIHNWEANPPASYTSSRDRTVIIFNRATGANFTPDDLEKLARELP
jgi:hypothetical protein